MKIPAATIEGYRDKNNQFIGLSGLQSVYEGFLEEIGVIKDRISSFNSVASKNLKSLSN